MLSRDHRGRYRASEEREFWGERLQGFRSLQKLLKRERQLTALARHLNLQLKTYRLYQLLKNLEKCGGVLSPNLITRPETLGSSNPMYLLATGIKLSRADCMNLDSLNLLLDTVVIERSLCTLRHLDHFHLTILAGDAVKAARGL